jgi:flagellar FliL protein
MATAPAAETAPAPQKKRLPPLWLLIVMATVVLGAGVGGAMALHLFGSGAARHGSSKAPSGPPIYLPLKPFVVNFQAGQLVRFLQVTVEVASRDRKTIELLKQNDPMVRNSLLLLLGSQRASTLETEAGKQKLRAEVLAAIRKVAAQNGGRPARIEAVYFTSFVMQ